MICDGKSITVLEWGRLKFRFWNRTCCRLLVIDDEDDERSVRLILNLCDKKLIRLWDWVFSKLARRGIFDKDVIIIGATFAICDEDSTWDYEIKRFSLYFKSYFHRSVNT
jgi:hypothetical protein